MARASERKRRAAGNSCCPWTRYVYRRLASPLTSMTASVCEFLSSVFSFVDPSAPSCFLSVAVFVSVLLCLYLFIYVWIRVFRVCIEWSCFSRMLLRLALNDAGDGYMITRFPSMMITYQELYRSTNGSLTVLSASYHPIADAVIRLVLKNHPFG